MRYRNFSAACFFVALMLCPGVAGAQSLIFDNSAGANQATTFRVAERGLLAQISVGASAVTISNIAVHVDLSTSANIKFLIFDGDAPGTSSLLYASTPKAFATGTNQWLMSDAFSYTLNPNTTYYIGGISDTSAFWHTDTMPNAQSGLSSVIPNGNVSTFATPVRSSNGASADSHVQLFQLIQATVPEPGSLALIALGFVGLGIQHRRLKTG